MSGCRNTESLNRLRIRLLDGEEVESWICAHGHGMFYGIVFG